MKNFKDGRGVALMLALVAFAVAEIIALSLTGLIANEAKMELRKADANVLFYGAEAGIEEAKYRVRNQSGWLESKVGLAEKDIGDTKVTVTVTGPDAGSYYLVTSTSRRPNFKLTRKISFKAKSAASASMSQFMFYFENAKLNVGAGAEIFGKVHSNQNVNLYGEGIVFHDDVTAVGNVNFYSDATPANTTFDKGYTEGAPWLAMPVVTEFDALKTIAADDGFYYAGNVDVELLDTGNIKINGAAAVPPPANGVIFSDQNINIKGTLNGRLTVAAMKTINITDNLIYDDHSSPPAPTASPRNSLGLIANEDIYIPDSAPHNMSIDAAMIARTGKVYCALSHKKNTLNIYGSICSHEQSYFASTWGYGYSPRHYYYDPDMQTNPPPHYMHFEFEAFKDWKDLGG